MDDAAEDPGRTDAEGSTAALPPGRRTIVLEGVRISYEVRGTGPLLVVHPGGPGSDPAVLRMPRVERFATVVYLDPVGSGESDRLPGGDYSIAAYARLAHLLISAVATAPVDFLGHSHGGMVALQLALDHPEDLRKLVIYDGLAADTEIAARATEHMDAFVRRFPGDPVALDARAAWDEDTAEGLPDAPPRSAAETIEVVRRLRPAYLADFTTSGPVLEKLQAMNLYVDPDRLPAAPWDVRERLSTIEVPTAVFVGRYDFIAGPQAATEIWRGIRSSRLVLFDDSGHFAHLEEPALFAARLRSFLES